MDALIIANELRIVLDWALNGLSRVIARDFRESVLPVAMVRARQNAVAQTNNVQSWVYDCGVAVKPGTTTEKGLLYEHYVKYCQKNGYASVCNVSQFYIRLAPIFPNMSETRKIVGSGDAKRRARCVDLVLGQFSSQSQIQVTVPVAQKPVQADDDFDPFDEIVSQALAIQKTPVTNIG